MQHERNGDSLVLAIDQGTSATKAVLVDAEGQVCERASVSIGQQFPGPGLAEQDAWEVWGSVQQAVRDCLAEVDASRVVAVGLSTQRESTLLWDRTTGEPLGPLLGWQDTRGSELCGQLRDAGHADAIREITGLPLDAMFSASKASWLLNTYDPDRSRSEAGALCLGTVDSWLLWQLGGGHLIEAGNASRTQLLDISSLRWSDRLLGLFEIPIQALPTVVSSVGPFTTTRNLDPLPETVPVTGVLGDSHAALFAHAGWQPGRVKVTYGTGSSVMGVTTRQQVPSSGVARTIAWKLDDPCYALEGNIRSSGATLVWLARLLGCSPGDVVARAADHSNGVVLVPAFTGLGAPWWDSEARGLVCGLTESSGAEHLARAALESIAFQVEDVVAAVENEAGAIELILADGGPSANTTLMQLQADTSGRQVESSSVAELSALGAAHIAGMGHGLWTVTDLEAMTSPRTAHRPGLNDTQREARQIVWHQAVDAARGNPKGD